MPTMTRKANGNRGKYFYAVVGGAKDRTYSVTGVDGGAVYSISQGNLAAVVSDVPFKRIRPERRHFAAHYSVLKQLVDEDALLPMAFGIISDGEKAVKTFLTKHRKPLSKQIERVAGKVEMGLKVVWDVPNIFEHMTNVHAELRFARDALLKDMRGAAQDEKIELGRMFESFLNSDREACSERVEAVLQPCCAEIKRNKCRDEREIMNLACLVVKENLDAFEAAVFRAARDFDDNFAFDYNGPWAPHNFVDMDVDI
jgi:hypothetical protein